MEPYITLTDITYKSELIPHLLSIRSRWRLSYKKNYEYQKRCGINSH